MSVATPVHGTDRRQFVGRAAASGAGVVVGGSAIEAFLPAIAAAHKGGVKERDLEILGAAQIAEALAVTTYTNIINTAPFFAHLESDDQGYLKAAREEEMSHYLLEESVTKKPFSFTTFYYPSQMFADAQTTLNVLVTLEDAFIAAYLRTVHARAARAARRISLVSRLRANSRGDLRVRQVRARLARSA